MTDSGSGVTLSASTHLKNLVYIHTLNVVTLIMKP